MHKNPVGFWIGECLEDLAVGLDHVGHVLQLPEYFSHLADLVVEAKTSDCVNAGNWRSLTNKMIYANLAKVFPVPKVEVEAGVAYKDVWRRLSSEVLSAVAKDTLFLLVHNKLPVKERLFRIGLAVDPYCDYCPGGVICNVEHFFSTCCRVSHVWGWVRGRLLEMLGSSAQCSNWELLNLFLPSSNSDKESVWLVGTYVAKVWEETFVRGRSWLRAEQFFGFLRFKYRSDQLGARMPLAIIPGLVG